jgi:hypothetical protein
MDPQLFSASFLYEFLVRELSMLSIFPAKAVPFYGIKAQALK